MDTIEGNKIIAEFMGLTVNPSDGGKTYAIGGAIEIEGQLFAESWERPQYHTSWDWIMPVVEKIEATKKYQVEIELFSCYIIDSSTVLDEIGIVIESHEDSKIKAVWLAVIEFINWYNHHPVK